MKSIKEQCAVLGIEVPVGITVSDALERGLEVPPGVPLYAVLVEHEPTDPTPLRLGPFDAPTGYAWKHQRTPYINGMAMFGVAGILGDQIGREIDEASLEGMKEKR